MGWRFGLSSALCVWISARHARLLEGGGGFGFQDIRFIHSTRGFMWLYVVLLVSACMGVYGFYLVFVKFGLSLFFCFVLELINLCLSWGNNLIT